MKKYIVVFVLGICFALLAMISPGNEEPSSSVVHTLDYFKLHSRQFAESSSLLQIAIRDLKEGDSATIVSAKNALVNCRMQYKTIEFFLNYFLPSTSIIYNAAPNYEVEVPFMEYREPTGLQLMESFLFESDPIAHKAGLLQQADLIASSAHDLNSLLYGLTINDKQVLESLRISLVGIIALGVTGFDAPELKTGIVEAKQSLLTIMDILAAYTANDRVGSDLLKLQLNKALKMLQQHQDFDTFNRARFLKYGAVPLLNQLDEFIEKNGFEWRTVPNLNYRKKHFFDESVITIGDTVEVHLPIISLGKKLFFEKALSGNLKRSCGTCHKPELYFTDGLEKGLAIDEHSKLERNTPSLFYTGLQHAQFLDGRSENLQDQILEVLSNPKEMDADPNVVVNRLKADKTYTEQFNLAFPGQGGNAISIDHITKAISSFLKKLAPFDSAFDHYMRGDEKAIDQAALKGFNLFMGKAKCATCHFIPVFNGLTPPLYERTDLEILGVTKDVDFQHPELDRDNGRFNTYPIVYFKAAFKTPTLRNVAMTAPYMHNGMFPTLESVMDFYNKGGGAGLGLDIPEQTLSAKPLGLTESEIKDIINFLNTLTDQKFKQ